MINLSDRTGLPYISVLHETDQELTCDKKYQQEDHKQQIGGIVSETQIML